MSEKNNAVIYGEIISKCWDNEDFKKKFVADPEGVLADAGFKLEEGVTYKVIEAPKLVNYIVIPYEGAKEAVQKLSAELLNRVENDEVVVPEGVEVRIVQNTDDVRNLILPASPKTLTAAELKAISGGDSVATYSDVVQTTE
ncbi:MAG: NHLP leader peptide family RiPP precursor, partial [Selenomonadaceae bacterium]|nr:NHLP leader peptide family RiPP precursor [Selenomonadaceae bacterium]